MSTYVLIPILIGHSYRGTVVSGVADRRSRSRTGGCVMIRPGRCTRSPASNFMRDVPEELASILLSC
jgi:hypothetical protein